MFLFETDKFQYLAGMKFLILYSLFLTEIHPNMTKVYKELARAFSIVRKGVAVHFLKIIHVKGDMKWQPPMKISKV